MRLTGRHLRGSVLPTVIVVSVLILTGMLGLYMLWEHETMLFARSCRLRQARADIESTYTLYRTYPGSEALTAQEGYRLHDSLPLSRVFIDVQPWGLYEAVRVRTADSLLHVCRLLGVEPEAANTLFYADNRSAVTIAGQTVLQGSLQLPQNGLIYGRIGSDFYRGAEIPRSVIQKSEGSIPAPATDMESRVKLIFTGAEHVSESSFPDSLQHSFLKDPAVSLQLGNAEIGNCALRGRIVLYADDLRIDSTCRIEHLLVCARKITVAHGARISAQLFARDTVLVEERAVLEYPSGIYAQQYAAIEERSEVNGYVIVRDTTERKKVSANYLQARTARVRGLVWVDGIAQLQGIVSGRTVLSRAVYFSPQGYYKDMLYDVTLLENTVTAQPLWTAGATTRRKEAVCVE